MTRAAADKCPLRVFQEDVLVFVQCSAVKPHRIPGTPVMCCGPPRSRLSVGVVVDHFQFAVERVDRLPSGDVAPEEGKHLRVSGLGTERRADSDCGKDGE
jgi:hypothetical protein